MKRISTSTAVQNKFVDGNKDTGLKPTKLNAEWFNQVQEEICKLLEAAGITVGGSDNQLAQLFTTLFVLEAAFKSLALKKSFSGGYSQTNINGENLKMLAEGTSVTDNSSVELSRLLMKFMKSSASGALITEISPAHFSVKASGSSDAVELEILNDRILFKSGDPLAQHASIVYDPTTGNLTITGIGGITLEFIDDNESKDDESGIEHYKHMACNMAFICEIMSGKLPQKCKTVQEIVEREG